jgi:outer membrane protein assembly factor BamB
MSFRNRALEVLIALAVADGGCPRAREAPADPLASLPAREVAVRIALPAPASTPLSAEGDLVVVGTQRGYAAVDLARRRVTWSIATAGPRFEPRISAGLVHLPFLDGAAPTVLAVGRKGGRERGRVRLSIAGVGGVAPALATPPAIAGGLVLWPSSRTLSAFSLETGAERWRYEAKGPTPFRRFQLGSETPVVDGGTVYWGHSQGLAALELATGRERWRHDAHRGFALRPVLGQRVIFLPIDAGIAALDRHGGALRWRFAPEPLRFERLAGEALAGLSGDLLWFVGEPEPFRYRLFRLDAATGGLRGASLLAAPSVTGSAASDERRAYLRHGENLVAYDLESGAPVWRARAGAGGPPVVVGGAVVFTSARGEVCGVLRGGPR